MLKMEYHRSIWYYSIHWQYVIIIFKVKLLMVDIFNPFRKSNIFWNGSFYFFLEVKCTNDPGDRVSDD